MNETTKTISQTVLRRIEHERLRPKSAWRFALKEAGVALVWFFSIGVGAIAVAVTLFAINYQRFALYEATHERWIDALIDQLPILWLLALTGSLLLAMYHLQHFRRGYRYPLWQLLFSSAAASVLIGIVLHTFGAGHVVDTMIGKRMPMYASFMQQEESLWQQPMEGRLVGRQIFGTISTTSTIIFEDVSGERWQMNTAELRPEETELLASKKQVRVLGFANNQLVHSFHACGAFAWLSNETMNSRDLSDERAAFVRRIYQYNTASNEPKIVVETTIANPEQRDGRCRHLPAVRRLEQASFAQ